MFGLNYLLFSLTVNFIYRYSFLWLLQLMSFLSLFQYKSLFLHQWLFIDCEEPKASALLFSFKEKECLPSTTNKFVNYCYPTESFWVQHTLLHIFRKLQYSLYLIILKLFSRSHSLLYTKYNLISSIFYVMNNNKRFAIPVTHETHNFMFLNPLFWFCLLVCF